MSGTRLEPDFLQIPHVLVRDSSLQPTDLIVYGVIYWLARLRDKKCTASNGYIAKRANCHKSTVRNCLSRLEEAGYVNRVFDEDGKRVEIVPLQVYPASNGAPPPHQMARPPASFDEQNNKSKEEKNNIVASDEDNKKQESQEGDDLSGKEFNFDEKMEKMRNEDADKLHGRMARIIYLYWSEKGYTFDTKEKYNTAYKRELPPAKKLAKAGYSGKDILDTIKYCRRAYDEWTLETVGKRIDDYIAGNLTRR